MRLQPLPTPCSVYEKNLLDHAERLNTFRKELLWEGNEPKCTPDTVVLLTWQNWERLFAHMQSLYNELMWHERERVDRIMEQV